MAQMSYIRNFRGWLVSVVFLAGFILVKCVFTDNGKENSFCEANGEQFSTFYSVKYQAESNFSDSIAVLLQRVNYSLSPFDSTSLVSAVNNNDTSVVADRWLLDVINLSQRVYSETEGAFDPTISPLVNAWGFGFKNDSMPTDDEVLKLKTLVGMDKISVTSQNRILKQNPGMTFNFSAIAKGYAVDLVAELLEKNGVENYLVNIGGEISCRGVNENGSAWQIGIDKPEETNFGGDIISVVSLSGKSLATSGNYRKFKVENGKKVWHIIDPRTGFPATTKVLSASVIADDCATADAYATALMVLGEEGLCLIDKRNDLDAMIICLSEEGEYELLYSKGMKNYFNR